VERLTLRALNRATLARQLLIERSPIAVPQAVEQLAGLNAQHSRSPYISLWSRLVGFDREELTQALSQRLVARATLMRSTQHLVSSRDYLSWRPALQETLLRAFRGYFGAEASRIDLARLSAAAYAYLAEQPRTFPELQAFLAILVPGENPASLSFAARAVLPLVQVHPAGTWRFSGSPAYFPGETWFGQPLAPPEEGRCQLVLRYLASFGPATRADFLSWSGMAGLRDVEKEVSQHLQTYTDEMGHELLDIAGAPMPDADTPVPVRLLPDWDNLLLGHADRTRVLPEAYRKQVIQTGGHVRPTFLVDGFVAGIWKIERRGKRAALVLSPFQALTPSAEAALVEEGERLLRFAEDESLAFAVELVR